MADSKNVDRIKREMSKVDTQLGVVDEEYDKIKVINTVVRNRLIGEEDKAQIMEDTLQVRNVSNLYFISSKGRYNIGTH